MRLAAAVLAAMLPGTAALAHDCRPLPELLVEAELYRGEVLESVRELPDGSVLAALSNPQAGTATVILVTEGAEVDQACVVE